jgi:leader peptidase (prepilin peptidase)/N-methyltransferase
MQIISYINPQMQVILVAIFALIFGSFATLLSYRMAKKLPIVFARSNCVNCHVPLKFYNLVPLFSWLFQRGKCSNCRSKISIRYPLIELSFLLSFLIIYFTLNQELTYKTLLYFAIAATLIVMIIVDLEEYFIPNSTQYFLTILVTLLAILENGQYGALLTLRAAFLYAGFGLALYIFFYLTTRLEAIGVDDIKFLFIAGLMLGEKNFLTFMLFSGIFGTVFGSIWQKVKKEETFPFAPALCLSAFICLLFGKKLDLIEFAGKMIF